LLAQRTSEFPKLRGTEAARDVETNERTIGSF